jgi:hypothetical protein
VTNPYVRRILSNVIGCDPLRVLASTPKEVKRLIRGLSDRQLSTRPEPGKWSIAEIICHLSDSEVVFAWRLRMTLAQSGARLEATDEMLWAEHLGYVVHRIRPKLNIFVALRQDHVDMLRALGPAAARRFGIHAERGRETVERMAQLFAGHDVNHLRQITRISRILRERRR